MKFLLILILTFSYAWGSECANGTLPIESVQGRSSQSPKEGEQVVVSGVVTATFQGRAQLSGFFLQDKDFDEKASHSLFVYSVSPVQPGLQVKLRGRVKEYYGLTELVDVTVLATCGTGMLPEALPLNADLSLSQREALEGVLVEVPSMFLAAHHEFERYGQIDLSHRWPAQGQNLNWSVDDGSRQRNPTEIGYVSDDSVVSSWVLGNRVKSFRAVVSFSFDRFRLLPVDPIEFESQNTLALAKPSGVRLLSLNVQNLFNGDGRGRQFLKQRGPKNIKEWDQKLSLLTRALAIADADVIVLNEVENDGFQSKSTSIQLLNALNDSLSTDQRYKAVAFNPMQTGSAAIQNVIFYRPKVLNTAGSGHSIEEFEDWESRWHRPFLSQDFKTKEGDTFRVVAGHLKSKAGKCTSDNPSTMTQYGACVGERLQAIEWLHKWLESKPVMKTALLGDLNSVPGETSISELTEKGWSTHDDIDKQYSYVFKGNPQVLDYIFLKGFAKNQTRNIQYWNINSGTLPQSAVASGLVDADVNNRFINFSDHDPVLIDIEF